MLNVLRSPKFFASRPWLKRLSAVLLLTSVGVLAIAPTVRQVAIAQASYSNPLNLDADITEANAVTGVVTARGNVKITYPARQIQATSVQAQYYTREGRIVLTGNVFVLQGENSLRGETITYLVNEGRFVATPENGRQVEAIYVIQDPNPPAGSAPASGQAPFNPKPEFKTPISPAAPQ
jgi:lipopolysaccharide export system protein LptA